MAGLRSRRVVVTNGPVLDMTINGKIPIGGAVTDTDGEVSVRLVVRAARWVEVDEVELIANGRSVGRWPCSTSETGITRFDEVHQIPMERDTWFVAVVRGQHTLEPVVPAAKGQGVTPLAFTNPIWVDADGNGTFDSLNQKDRPDEPGAPRPPKPARETAATP